LTSPAGFAHLEVPQVVDLGDRAVLIFSCHQRDLDTTRGTLSPPRTATWIAPASGLLGPFDLQSATAFPDTTVYAARLVRTGPDHWALLGFRGQDDGKFGGLIDDPVPLPDQPFRRIPAAVRLTWHDIGL
jgi:beta-fructofuranosidase